jgi:hypothetical protein
MTDGCEALSLLQHAMKIMDRMDLTLAAAHLSMSIAALEESASLADENSALY